MVTKEILMRANNSDLEEKPVASRPICGWAGIALSTYDRLMPWAKTDKSEESSSVTLGAGFAALQITVPNAAIDFFKNKINNLVKTEKPQDPVPTAEPVTEQPTTP